MTERPAVTVSGAAAHSGRPDVLEGGPRRRPLTARARQRSIVVGLLALALFAGAVGLVRIADARRGEAEQERVAGLVALSVTGVGATSSRIAGDGDALRLALALQVLLRNDGPRPVTVERAALGAYVAEGAAEILPGEEQAVVLRRLVVCPQSPGIPDLDPAPASLGLAVRTAAGPVSTDVPLPARTAADVPAAVQRACGVLPLPEGLLVTGVESERLGTTVRVRLGLANRTSQRTRLTQLTVQQGLRGEVRTARLPLDLPATPAGTASRAVALEVELSVTSCRSIFELTPAPPEQQTLDTLLVTLEDPSGRSIGPIEAELDVPELRELVSDVC